MKTLTRTLLIAALLPLAGCVTFPGGYSPGAYNGYDPSFDSGYQGYQRPVTYDFGRPLAYGDYPPDAQYYYPRPY